METITENIDSDRFRFVVIEISDKGKDKSDLIQIGENYYCRKNNGAWKKSKEGCDSGGGISGFSNVASQQFFVETTVENGKSVRFYRQYIVHKNKDTSGKDVLWYWDSKFWISEGGIFLRQETEAGLKETNEIRSKGVTTYEYNPKDLKIEAPVKP